MVKFLKRLLSESQIEWLKLLLYKKPVYNNKIKLLNFENVKIKTTFDTLEAIKSTIVNSKPGCYIRFGDGDVFLLKNIGKHRNQRFNEKLSNELKEAISLSGDGVLKSLAINSERYGLEKEMDFGIHQVPNGQADKLLCNSYEFFIGEKIYSPVAMHYEIIYNRKLAIEMLAMLRGYKPIFVGSDQNSPDMLKRLFNTTDIVSTLHRNTYETIDELEIKLLEKLSARNLAYDVVILSCGSTAKALIKRLYLNYDKPIFLFDMGSVVDLFHGRMKWTWVKKSGIDNYYLEEILCDLEGE